MIDRILLRARLGFLVAFAALWPLSAAATTRITLIHFSDYHSHALPHDSEGRQRQGGIARAAGYMKRAKRQGAFVFSGGDMINRGSPAWSDKYRCAEWPWFNGVVDAMAFGNHDADYGPAVFAECRRGLQYPIVSANVEDAEGRPLFDRHVVLERRGIRIGVFAVAGPDFETLVRPQYRPAAGARFTDSIAAAREVVQELRETHRVDAVIMIGHQHRDDDFALARAVPGIDLIFGSHTHHREPLTRIEGTNTWFISAFQYLTWLARVDLTFEGRKLARVDGRLVRVDESIPSDRAVSRRVATMQRELTRDPVYRDLFQTVGVASCALSIEGQNRGDSALGDLTLDLMRKAVGADVALSTSSSFRQPVPAGAVTFEDLRNALPYDNEIVVCEMRGDELKKLLAFAASKIGSDSFVQISGVRLTIDRRGAVVADGVEADRVYRVATTDYLAGVAPGYRDFFASRVMRASGYRVRDELRKYMAHGAVCAARDGRIEVRP